MPRRSASGEGSEGEGGDGGGESKRSTDEAVSRWWTLKADCWGVGRRGVEEGVERRGVRGLSKPSLLGVPAVERGQVRVGGAMP